MTAPPKTGRSRRARPTGSSVPSVPLRAVAALFLERQHLSRPRGRRMTANGLARFAEDVGGIQLDSINVVERAHYLTLWSRFGLYDKRKLDRLVYRRRVLFEYWAHAACLLSSRDLGPWRRAMLDYRIRHRGWSSWLQKNRSVLVAVEETIHREGPTGNARFEHVRPAGDRGGWWNWKPAAHALDYLWMSGRTLVDSRVHFQKRFDLAERVLPAMTALTPPSTAEFRRWHVRQALHAMGAATETDLRMYLTFPRIEAGERRRMVGDLIRAGEVVELAVEGGGASASKARWFALAADVPALQAAGRRRSASRGTTLLSPFDSVLWHRDRVSRLFGYDYKIEVYTPGPKRKHGYYLLPMFHDGHFIGRLDPKTHRGEGWLEVRSVHFEPWWSRGAPPPAASWGRLDPDAALAGLAEALRSLATFVGAHRVTIGRVSPTRFALPLRRALRAADPEPPKPADEAMEPLPAGSSG